MTHPLVQVTLLHYQMCRLFQIRIIVLLITVGIALHAEERGFARPVMGLKDIGRIQDFILAKTPKNGLHVFPVMAQANVLIAMGEDILINFRYMV